VGLRQRNDGRQHCLKKCASLLGIAADIYEAEEFQEIEVVGSQEASDRKKRTEMGVAVLLDVTLVRMALVTAAMSLLGHRAWWLPAPLAWARPHNGPRGHRAPR